MRKYTKEHEWIDVADDEATVGITSFAQNALGDVVYVELPAPGKQLNAKQEAAVVESVKAASDVYAPVAGTVTAVNDKLITDPSLVNRSADSEGWFFKLKLANAGELDGLMDEDGYKAHVGELG